ncbi:transketolase C-terminal domain-containing protein [Mycolicibacterium brumae]|uniref:transketolase C-terminal domain-containing protein n=1 Tax=Mycolicibacterium brumae TaxID=85968 RepID=UPI001F1DE079|nr:transketolase C-terminal domain-containing protein [Mycolicibacterium brumae]UWW10033.1 hypothetical protein L2Z93_003151 [Mycolicibacterium brumae]
MSSIDLAKRHFNLFSDPWLDFNVAPLDVETIAASVRATGHLLVVDPANRTAGAAAEICAAIAERAPAGLRAPIRRHTAPDVHAPFSPTMEKPLYPDKESIIAEIWATIRPARAPRGDRTAAAWRAPRRR